MKHAAGFLLMSFFISCIKPVQPNNEITKVELARSGAWSDYGAAISVDSSLSYKYCDNNQKQHYFVGKVDEKFWDTLNRKLEEVKFRSLPATDNKHIEDAEYYELIIHWKNKKRRLTRVWDFPQQDSVLNVIKWLNDSYKRAKLHQVNYPIKFETTYQNPPIQPKIDQVKFPPPIKR